MQAPVVFLANPTWHSLHLVPWYPSAQMQFPSASQFLDPISEHWQAKDRSLGFSIILEKKVKKCSWKCYFLEVDLPWHSGNPWCSGSHSLHLSPWTSHRHLHLPCSSQVRSPFSTPSLLHPQAKWWNFRNKFFID